MERVEIFSASSGLEAHMINNLLDSEGIDGEVLGEYLSGAIGELPAGGFVKVVVDASDAERAKEVIKKWEEQQPKPPTTHSSKQQPSFSLGFLEGILLGAFLGFLVCHMLN